MWHKAISAYHHVAYVPLDAVMSYEPLPSCWVLTDEAVGWLAEHCDPADWVLWTIEPSHKRMSLAFLAEADATLFKLRFS